MAVVAVAMMYGGDWSLLLSSFRGGGVSCAGRKNRREPTPGKASQGGADEEVEEKATAKRAVRHDEIGQNANIGHDTDCNSIKLILLCQVSSGGRQARTTRPDAQVTQRHSTIHHKKTQKTFTVSVLIRLR